MWLIVTRYLYICHRFRDKTSEVSKNDHVLFFAWGPDAPNDLKLVSGVDSLSIYHREKKSDFWII